MNKRFIVTAIGVLASIVAIAQPTHEFSVNGFGGLQGLQYSIDNQPAISTSKSFGGGGGLGYAYNFDQNWAIQTGLDISYYSTKAEGNINGTYTTTGATFTYATTGYEETQKLLQVEIPIMARYTAPLDATSALQFGAGFKIGIPASKKYRASAAGHMTQTGDLDFERVHYDFGEIFPTATPTKVNEYTGDFDSNISLQLQLEAGYRYSISEQLGLYAGLYFQYGLNNLQKKDDGNLVTIKADGNMNITAPVASYNESLLNTNMVDSFRPMAIGLKLRLSFGL